MRHSTTCDVNAIDGNGTRAPHEAHMP